MSQARIFLKPPAHKETKGVGADKRNFKRNERESWFCLLYPSLALHDLYIGSNDKSNSPPPSRAPRTDWGTDVSRETIVSVTTQPVPDLWVSLIQMFGHTSMVIWLDKFKNKFENLKKRQKGKIRTSHVFRYRCWCRVLPLGSIRALKKTEHSFTLYGPSSLTKVSIYDPVLMSWLKMSHIKQNPLTVVF